MGLTIHYKLELSGASIDQAKEKMAQLRQFALDLPCPRVSELIELAEDDCFIDPDRNVYDRYRFFKISAIKRQLINAEDITDNNEDEDEDEDEDGEYEELEPTHLICFNTFPGEGSESAVFGLAIHSRPSESNDWYWASFCKTQYASNPKYGGIQNFITAHLIVIKILKEAQKLGINCEVHDDGGYWETENIQELISNVQQSNELVASITGALNEQLAYLFQQKNIQVIAPISEYPDFEYSEPDDSKR